MRSSNVFVRQIIIDKTLSYSGAPFWIVTFRVLFCSDIVFFLAFIEFKSLFIRQKMSKRKMGLFYCRDFCILVHLIFQLCLGIWRIIVEIAIFTCSEFICVFGTLIRTFSEFICVLKLRFGALYVSRASTTPVKFEICFWSAR